MTIRECIEALQTIAQEHGPDVLVFHHDDWNYFLVTSITVVLSQDGTDPIENMAHPTYVQIEGDDQRFQADGTLSTPFYTKE
jgi:hypothetical protein